jgi:S1-C subfamily serine protease
LNESQPGDGTSSIGRNDISGDDLLLDEYSRSVVSAVSRVAPAVVNIEIKQRGKGRPRDVAGSGSGFVIAPDGFILTNSHVVHRPDNVNWMATVSAQLIGRLWTDLAVIRIVRPTYPAPGAICASAK